MSCFLPAVNRKKTQKISFFVNVLNKDAYSQHPAKTCVAYPQITQLEFTCSKSTIKTVETKSEICLKLIVIDVVLVFLLLTLNIFHIFF